MSESLRDLRLFVAVYEERSFTAAARREHATQSGVSHHIRKLEQRRGTTLFIRGAGLGVTPTPAGDAYYRGCIGTLRAFDEANDSLREFGAGDDGEVLVGLVPTISQPLLARTLAAFIDRHPNVVIRTVEAPSVRLISEIRAGELDFAVGFAVPGEIGVNCTPFARTPCYLVSSPQASRPPSADLTEMQSLRLAAPPRANAIRAAIESVLASHGVLVDRWLEIDSMAATLDFVSRSDWVCIVPGLVLADPALRNRVRATRLRRPEITLELSLIQPLRRQLGAPSRAFLNILRREAEHQGRRLIEVIGPSTAATRGRLGRGRRPPKQPGARPPHPDGA